MLRNLSFVTFAAIMGLPLAAQAGSRMLTVKELPNKNYVVGGTDVETCQWPTSVSLGGCTGTLVHPRLVTYAAHCGTNARSITLGERHGAGRTAGVDHCVAHPSFANNFGDGVDFAYCVLSEEVTDVPLTPVIQGCELDAVKAGASVWIVGFGATAGQDVGSPGGGTKRQVEVSINELVETGEVNVGGGGKGACHGDSGGPLFMQLPVEIDPQQGWRVIGATSWGSSTCPGESNYSYLPDEDGVPWIESDSGIDITPCHDAVTGEWQPGDDCKDFASDPPATGRSWDDGCSQELVNHTNCGGALPDEEKPTVEVTDPKDGDELEADSKVTVTVTAADNVAVVSVELFVDGKSEGKVEKEPYEWADIALEAGEHELTAVALDEAGNEGDSEVVKVTVADDDDDDETTSSDDDDDDASDDDDDDSSSGDDDDDDASDDDDDDSSSGDDDDDDSSGDDDDDNDDDDDSTEEGDDDDDDDDGSLEDDTASGKGCAVAAGSSAGWLAGLSVLALWRRRRR